MSFSYWSGSAIRNPDAASRMGGLMRIVGGGEEEQGQKGQELRYLCICSVHRKSTLQLTFSSSLVDFKWTLEST